MRIAHTVPRYAPHAGGVQTHVAQIARRVAAYGHEVEVLTQETDYGLPPVEMIDGVRVRRFPLLFPRRRYELAPNLWAYLARHGSRYDIVHAHSYHVPLSLAVALTARRPLVFTPHYHGTGRTRLGRFLHPPYRLLGAWIFHRSSRVICVSEAEATLVRRHFPHAARRIAVIPNGVDVSAVQAAQPYHTDRTLILTGGRLIDSKNVHLTIEAITDLDDTFALCVIGDGPARATLEDLVDRLSLRRRVRFLGHVEDATLYRWLRTAAVYVSMSRQEAFGLTLAEAVAAGAAIVASDIPAHAEVVATAGGGDAVLVPLSATPSALARVIRDLAGDRREDRAARTLLSWDEVAARTMAVYETVIVEERKRGRP